MAPIETTELIPVFTGAIQGQPAQLCDARTLHAFLNVQRDFATWTKARIKKFGFVEGVDYLVTKTGEQLPSGTKYSIDYHLVLDVAKELAMVENNDKGREARRYFIECERRANTPSLMITGPIPTLNNPVMNMIVQQAIQYDRMEQEQKALAEAMQVQTAQLTKTNEVVDQIALRVGAQDAKFFTVLAYARLKGMSLTHAAAASIGRSAAKRSKTMGFETGKVLDERYGRVNTYHESVLAVEMG